MRFRLIAQSTLFAVMSSLLLTRPAFAKTTPSFADTLNEAEIVKQLGWIHTNENRCGGHYVEAPFTYSQVLYNSGAVEITSDQLLFAQHGTSIGRGKVTITRYGQQVIANKAYLYRDPQTGKVNAIELHDNVTLREPNSLILADSGQYHLPSKSESLHDILYRTAIYSDSNAHPLPSNAALQEERNISQLSAWGEATDFNQDLPKIYEFDQATYSTCPPDTSVWQVRTSHLTLDKTTGRGSAYNARILVKGVPVFYSPYLNFPIDKRRKTGFLWPTEGSSSQSGPYLRVPFYWNMAPNYDTTITPSFLSKRGLQLSDTSRYLTQDTTGNFTVEVLPGDKDFSIFQSDSEGSFGNSTDPVTQAELRRLEQASTTRKALNWQNRTRFNEHWSGDVDYNYVSDDYYLRDFSNNLDQITQNQLLQQGEIDYKGQNWNFTGRLQSYQTLHPVDQIGITQNAYSRVPQLTLNGDYPDTPGDVDYFISNDVTHFSILNTPGSTIKFPVGDRLNTQPGISRPFNWPFLSITPRLQFAMTKYDLGDVNDPNPKGPSRTLPIFDLNSSLYFDRNVSFLKTAYRQTLEPQIYYVYIPFRQQDQLPVFDTTVNTLTYDELFMYNRFSGIDRINDANQVAVGISSRFIDEQTGAEKIKMAAGEIFYFKKREVTLCTSASDPLCQNATDVPGNPDNSNNRSPLTGLLSYTVNPSWSATANTIWNPKTSRVDNQSAGLHYQEPGTQKIVNLGYNFVRNGDVLYPDELNSVEANLSSTDMSFNWPLLRDWSVIGRWTQNWNHHHLQNLLYGLQYDACCWAARFVAGRAFTNLNLNNTFQYNTQFYVQFALKGLGTTPITGGDPSQVLTTNISGYVNNFGRDF